MTNIRKSLLPAVAALSLAISATVQVQAQPQGDPLAIYKLAGASDKQQKQITAAREEFEALAHSCNQRASEAQHKLHDLSLQPLPDEKAALAAQKEMNDVMTQLSVAHVKMMIKARTILTPPQRQKVVDLLKQREAAPHSGGGAPGGH